MLMQEQLPVFVYGTLRPGQGNYRRILRDVTEAEYPAMLTGHALYAAGVPFAVPMTGRAVRGDLMVVRAEEWAPTLSELDALEGFRPDASRASSLYVRTACTVVYVNDGLPQAAEAWVYLAGGLVTFDELDVLVPGGDWLAFAPEPRRAA